MSNRYIDATTNDATIATPWLLSYSDKARQKIQTAMNTQRGEWFLDASVGIPWLEWLTERDPSLSEISDTIRADLLKITEVVSVSESRAVLDESTQTIEYSARVQIGNGEVFELSATRQANEYLGINGTHLVAIWLQNMRGVNVTN